MPEAQVGDRAGARRRGRVVLLLAALVLGFAAFAAPHFFPPQPYGIADDYRIFYAATRVVAAHGDVYDTATIHAAEQSAQHYAHVQPSLDDFVNLPVVAWVLQPFGLPPFWVSYAVWSLAGMAAVAAVTALWARRLGWRLWPPLVLLVLLSWISLLGFASGQFDALMLAGVFAAVSLAGARRVALAGVACAVLWVKPDVLWPLLPFLAAALWPDRRAVLGLLGGFAATSGVLLAVQLVLIPGSTAAWWQHIRVFASRIPTVQPDQAGLPGLLRPLIGDFGGVLTPRIGPVVVLGVLAAVAFAVWTHRSHAWAARPRAERLAGAVGVPLALWLLVTPYSHPNDDILLLPALLLVLGPDARRLGGPGAVWAAWLLVVTPLVWPLRILPAVCAPVLLGAVVAAMLPSRLVGGRRREGFGAAGAALALVVLPAVWPFHALSFSLTPIAVLILCVEALVAATEAPLRVAGAAEEPGPRGHTGPVVRRLPAAS